MDEFAPMPTGLIRQALDAAPDALLMIDDAGYVVFANQRASPLFGYEHAQMIGERVEVLLPALAASGRMLKMGADFEAGQRRVPGGGSDLVGVRGDGTEIAVEIGLSEVTDCGVPLVIAAVRDVTEHKRVLAELEEARALADRASRAKSRFLATASHDLRQPLQTIALLTGSLQRMAVGADLQSVLQQQEQAVGAMSRLLNALLDISKLESGVIKPDISDFALDALLDGLRAEFSGVAASKGLELAIEPCDETVHSDPSLVGQVLANLLSNAIKYTHRGLVRLHCLRDQAFVRIEVLDTGIGIPMDQLACIYDEFYQLSVPPNITRDGYGLGLTIVDRVVRLLGVKLDVRSEIAKGSVFALTLPASGTGSSNPRIARSGAHRRDSGATALPGVLLVEDDPAVCAATRLLLKSVGYRVIAVATVDEAADRAASSDEFSLLITDFHLGTEATGVDVIERVRAARGSRLRAVLLTGDTSSVIRNLACDADTRIVSKPIDPEEFLALLAELHSVDPRRP